MSGQAKLARELYPFLVEMGMAVRGGGGGTSGGMVKHDLNGPYHNGVLAQSQAPWAATVSALNAHATNPNAHHARQHSIISTSDHTIGGSAWDLVGKTAGGTLGLLSPSADVSGGASAILRSNSGDLTVNVLTAAGSGGKVRTPTIDTASGNLAISPASGITTLSDLRATTRLRTPLIDTASGDLALAPESGVVTLEQLEASVRVWTPRLTYNGELTVDPTGDITLDPGGNDVIVQDAAARALRSSNYAVGFPLAGFRIGTTTLAGQYGVRAGVGEFDELRARIFVADETRVDRGQEYITKSYGVLSRPFTAPASIGDAAHIYFENSPHIAGALFSNSDWVLLRYLDMSGGIVLASVWGQVTVYTTTGLTGEQRWTFTLRQGTGGLEFLKGALAVNFGASGQGYILSDAISADAPFIQIGFWTTNPYTPANRTVTTQIGRLDGVGFTGEYGLAAAVTGFGTSEAWVKVSTTEARLNNVPIRMYNGGVHTGMWSANGQLDIGFDGIGTANDRDFSVHMSGYVRVGRVGTNKPNLYYSAADGLLLRQNTTPLITLGSDGSSYFSGRMEIGPDGEIVQGSGTKGTAGTWSGAWGSFTGLRIGRAGSVGRLAGYSGGTLQAGFDSTGRITAGGGNVVLDEDGITFDPDSLTAFMRVVDPIATHPERVRWINYTTTGNTATEARWQALGGGTVRTFVRMTATDAGAGNLYLETPGTISLTGALMQASGDAQITGTLSLTGDNTGEPIVRVLGEATGLLGGSANVGLMLDSAAVLESHLDNADSALRLGIGNGYSRGAMVELYAWGGDPSTYNTRLIRTSGQNGPLYLINQGTGGIALNNVGAGTLGLATNNTTRLFIEADGDVGIGNTSPAAKLHVSGEIMAQFLISTVSKTPTGSTDSSGTQGEIRWDASYLYVRVANSGNYWKRVSLSNF